MGSQFQQLQERGSPSEVRSFFNAWHAEDAGWGHHSCDRHGIEAGPNYPVDLQLRAPWRKWTACGQQFQIFDPTRFKKTCNILK